MANEEVLGPRKTMFVLVIVVGCFAVLWPRILSPLIVGHTRDKLQPNQFDREAGCCEVMFEKELAVLELINEVCSSGIQGDGKLSPYSAAECRRTVNETCGLDIAAFLKRSENIGKTSKMLINTMQSTNSSCLRENFGVPVFSLGPHLAQNSWTLPDTVKQERPATRGSGPHPALRERGRAIPPGTPPPPSRGTHIQLPPHARPPPIPGMRPPLGSPGGPVAAPKSSMGFVMPIYTICIIVFFVYTVSKIFFKRATVPYEPVSPDPQFRRRVFRDDSRTSPDKLVVTAISGLVAEVQQQMEASYAQNQQRQEATDNHARPYTNGTVLHNSGPVHIIASEYHEAAKDKNLEKEPSSEPKESSPEPKESSPEPKESFLEKKELSPEPKELSPEPYETSPEPKESSPEPKESSPEPKELTSEPKEKFDQKEKSPEPKESSPEPSPKQKESSPEPKSKAVLEEEKDREEVEEELIPELESNHKESVLIDLAKPIELKKNGDVINKMNEFIKEEVRSEEQTKELLEEAIDEGEDKDGEHENSSVKVMGMEIRTASADGGPPAPGAPAPGAPAAPAPRNTHEAAEVKSIFLETDIPQQSRVLVANFQEDTPRPAPQDHAPMVVSGKMTLSLIQDAPRETPERDPESIVDDFTTASAVTQNAEKDDDSDEELEEEEVEIEEIEEEIEVEDEDEEEEEEQKEKVKGTE